ncbi:uncharacterized protein SCODWIG_00327 [Saccharomycodes ludwigii]|uniref:Pyridoxamine 5'-phosphate oxidase Alr4036 family FMN-binding domain-containing protein n=1 Tax=Saccharomycodes ludwigii TaxID=36035 RepID=A0A376B1J5_9ASCO|nr:hypothetical protein SCDLUD_001446 [Saccharomycodes ludwigii]KAH3901675.1 hypothetical protein SCDLUD_001446 [Saccharomycodes ludwigii]SSD58566.1 uncharacterized protein SCODWIG_00327 [Saccharomycodes ludwigii]
MSHQMAPWVPIFIQSVKNNSQSFTSFQLSSISAVIQKDIHNQQSSISYRPKCRTVVFRDFLFHDKHSNIITFSTDLRSDKIDQLTEQPCFEACFYFSNTWEQFRLRGDVSFILSDGKYPNIISNICDHNNGNSGNDTVINYPILSPSVCNHSKEKNGHPDIHHSTLVDDVDITEGYKPPEPFEWDLELKRQWNNLSRNAKAQYRRPEPGLPMSNELSKKLDKLSRGVDGVKEDIGFQNFAIVCLCIDEVDYLNLKDDGKSGAERWIFKRFIDEDTGIETWEEKEVCP